VFEQFDRQLMLNDAGRVKEFISDILSLWNRAANRIDFFQVTNE
jgi:hypothetical protein